MRMIALPSISVPAQAYQLALKSCHLYASEKTLDELANVLRRDYLDRYLEREEREKFLLVYRGMSILKPADFVALQRLPPGASLTI